LIFFISDEAFTRFVIGASGPEISAPRRPGSPSARSCTVTPLRFARWAFSRMSRRGTSIIHSCP